MTYTSKITYNLHLLDAGPIDVTQLTTFLDESGRPVGIPTRHQFILVPTDDISGYPQDIQDQCRGWWTTDRVSTWKALIASN